MGKIVRKTTLWVVSLLFALCVSILGIHTVFSANAEDASVEVTFTHINSSWNDNSQTLGNGMHYTVLHLDGLLTSGYLGQGDDWSGMNASVNGGASYFNFSPASYMTGPNVASNYIIIYSATAPTEGDIFTVTAGSTFKVGGNDTNVYELTNDICLQFNGTAWAIYTPPAEPVSVTFTNINASWNNSPLLDTYCTIFHFDGGISGGGADRDFSDLMAKMTINDEPIDPANVYFEQGSWIGATGCIIMRVVQNPAEGSILKMPAGATFTMGGADTNVYEIASDTYFQLNATGWAIYTPPAEPVEVTFTDINSSWNNSFLLDTYCTIFRFDGGISGGGSDRDFSNLMAKMTINDEPIDPANVYFEQGSWIGATDCIIMRVVQNPAQASILKMPAGATFTVGGTDTNVYEIASDIYFQYNGTVWEVYTPSVEPDEPDVPPVEPTEPVEVTFTHINSSWNDNQSLNNGMHYTILHLNGVQTSGYYTQGDDWTDMMANATINGGESYFDFCPASFIAGPNVVSDMIIIYSATAPTLGDEFIVTAGATFKVGGDDANVYELANDICLKFNGTAWEVYDPNAQPPVEPPVEPPVIEPTEPVAVTFNSIHREWNNYNYTAEGYFCTYILLDGGIGGGSLDGDFSDLLSKMTLNGQPVDTENASLICPAWIGATDGLVLRFRSLPADNSVLVMPAGATFTVGGDDTNLYEIAEDIELKIKNGKWSTPLPMAEFLEVNSWNNNIFTQAGTRLTILDFNVENLGNVVSTDKNLIAMSGITVNGVKLTDIEGASVTYAHGANYLAIDLPQSAIYPTEAYPITVMKVEAGTVFENYELPEITLSLIGGTWLVGECEVMPTEENYVTVSDLVDTDRYEIGTQGYVSAVAGYEGDVHLKLVYYTDEAIQNYAPYGGLIVYLNSTNLWDGWRFLFMGNKVYVYDATMGGDGDEHVLIGEADFGIANGIEMQLEISVTETDGKYSIVIGGSCAKILGINDITPIGDCIGGGIMFYSSMRSCRIKDYKYGDVFDPVLTVYSKQEIVLNEGDAVPEIDAKAMDGMTEITPTYVWDDGAITDGKMNAGIWICTVTATDENGNYTTATIRVTVKGEPKYTVTFDGKNEAEYAYGAKIDKPEDPTKEATAKVQYTFDGWYNGEEKWDFENDVVTGDVALVAKFVESDVYYKVTVTLSSGESQVIYVTYGAQVDLSVFDKEGFEKEVKQNGEVITKLIVTEDTAIEITYTQPTSDTPSGGCAGGCAGSLTGIGGLGVLLTAIGGCMLMRKKEETDEK